MTSQAYHSEHGPALRVSIDNVAAAKQLFHRDGTMGLGVPAAVSGWALLDTGATHSCVDSRVRDLLRLPHVHAASFAAVSAQPTARHYTSWHHAEITIQGLSVYRRNVAAIAPLGARTLRADSLIMLIGRDILDDYVVVFNGPDQLLELRRK